MNKEQKRNSEKPFSVRRFTSKLLLLGEYGVVLGSKALCMPYSVLSGSIELVHSNNTDAAESNKSLKKLYTYIIGNPQLKHIFDCELFEYEAAHGLIFSSNIPIGYGLGSSGALCAAVYDRYALRKASDPVMLKQELALVESCFHGSSSGLDPLVSYLNSPVLIAGGNVVASPTLADEVFRKGTFFLIDTGITRMSTPLITSFIDRMKADEGQRLQLINVVNRCVDAALGNSIQCFTNRFSELSQHQLENMSELIPQMFKKLWEKGLSSETYKLKLCGAGGGGFILGFTADFGAAKELLLKDGITAIPVLSGI